MIPTKRLRIFAGPNGSGKSTLVKLVEKLKVDLGIFINADDIKKSINFNKFLDFTAYDFILDIESFKTAFENSSLFIPSDGNELLPGLQFKDNQLFISNEVTVNDYFTSFISDYLRTQLLNTGCKFTFETVMSHPSKLEFIHLAKKRGYRIYLYFVALDNPALCIARVEARVKQEGHNVPPHKVIERYERTMNSLLDAIRIADRAYVFDNSYSEPKLFAIANNKEFQ